MGSVVNVVILVLVSAAALVSRLPRLRTLPAEKRLAAVAISCAIPLLILRVTVLWLGKALALSTDQPLLLRLLTVIAAISTSFALGLIWSAILDDSRRPISRILVACLALGFLLLSLSSVPAWPFLVLIIAFRSGWLEVAPEKTIFATVASIVGLAFTIYWPSLPAMPACWPPGCWFGTSLLRHANSFLIVQLGIVSVRLIFRILFGPRRIGRRLLVSHMMAGAVPSALIVIFLMLVALLAVAGFRANLGHRLVSARHAVSQQMLAGCMAYLMQERGHGARPVTSQTYLDPESPGPEDPEWLVHFAEQLAACSPEAARWSPLRAATGEGTSAPGETGAHYAGTSSRLFVALRMGRGEDARYVLADIIRAGIDSTRAIGWIANASEQHGDVTRLRVLPGPRDWMELRPDPCCGIVRAAGMSFHVADSSALEGGVEWRAQLIEPLPYGRVRILEQLLGERAWLEDRMRFTFYRSGIRGEMTSEDEPQPSGQLELLSDPLAARSPAPRRTTSYRSSYVLVPAQEWVPAGTAVPDSSAPLDDARRKVSTESTWAEIRLPILGVSELSDLMPPIPALRENPLSALPLVILGATALLFIVVEAGAFASALRIGRAIAQSVGLLREGTERLRTGDFTHRIRMESNDELTTLGAAFNEMAAGLEEGRRAALDRERLEGELEVARRIQQRLLPEHPPVIPGLEIAGLSVPARQVGGDYYDLLELQSGRLLFVLADVSGKGVPAALLMSSVRASLHTMVGAEENLRVIVSRLNRFIHSSTAETEFVTLFIGLLAAQTGQLIYVNAGHDRPFVMRANGQLETLPGGGMLLGAFPGVEYEESHAVLASGDMMFLYTDGLSEAMDPDAQLFGEERIITLLTSARERPPEALLQLALARMHDFTRGAEPSDDVTLLAIRRDGGPGPGVAP